MLRCTGPSSGMRTSTTVPCPGTLLILRSPPCSPTSPLTVARPRPVPSWLARVIVLHLAERLAEGLEIRFGNADARIADGEGQHVIFDQCVDRDDAAGSR